MSACSDFILTSAQFNIVQSGDSTPIHQKFDFTGDGSSTSSFTSSSYSDSSEEHLPAMVLPTLSADVDLLGKLNSLTVGGDHSSSSGSSWSSSESGSFSSEEEQPVLSFAKTNTNDLLAQLNAFKKGSSAKPASPVAAKPVSKPAPPRTKKVEKPESPKTDEEEEMFNLSAIKGSKLRGMGSKTLPSKTRAPSASPKSSKKDAISSTKKSSSRPNFRPKPETSEAPKKAQEEDPLIVDDGGGQNVFQLFMRMNELKKKEEAAIDEKDEEYEPEEEVEVDLEPEAVLALNLEYGIKDDCNKAGMKRGKKGNMLAARRNRFQMEDTHVVHFPLDRNKDVALFCVFDGHAGKGCSTSLTKIFPRVFGKQFASGGWINKTDLTDLWKSVYAEVDKQLEEYEDEGATSTTVLIWRNPETGMRYLQSANLGDSACFLRRSGKAIGLTEEHKPTSKAERERMKKMGIELGTGQTRLNGLAVSRAFGNHFPKVCSIYFASSY